jgi:hypothetical protein
MGNWIRLILHGKAASRKDIRALTAYLICTGSPS